MKKYEDTLLQELLTVPIHFVWWFLFTWLAVIGGLNLFSLCDQGGSYGNY